MLAYSQYKNLAVAVDGKSGIVVVESQELGYPVPLKYIGDNAHLLFERACKKLGWVKDARCRHGYRRIKDKVKRVSLKQRAEAMLDFSIELFEKHEGITYRHSVSFDDCKTDMGRLMFGEISALEELLS